MRRYELLALPVAVLLILAFSGSLIPSPPVATPSVAMGNTDAAPCAAREHRAAPPLSDRDAFALQARLQPAR